MTLEQYLDLFETYFGFWRGEREEVKRVALRDRDNARICFAALARDIAADPRHGINERLKQTKEQHETQTTLHTTTD